MDLQGKADNDDVTVGDVPMFAKWGRACWLR